MMPDPVIDDRLRLSFLIQERLAKFGRAVDAGRFHDLDQVFASDVVGIYNGRVGHRSLEALIRSMEHNRGPQSQCSGGQHNVLNVEATFHGRDEAESKANFYAIQIGRHRYQGKYWSTWGEYNDFWRLTDEGWRIYERRYTTTFSDGEGAIVGQY